MNGTQQLLDCMQHGCMATWQGQKASATGKANSQRTHRQDQQGLLADRPKAGLMTISMFSGFFPRLTLGPGVDCGVPCVCH